MLVLRAADRIARPWKNGGGITRDVFTHPEGAALETFDWRVSLADVATDGPFSHFPGIDRTTAILSGAGFDLTVKGDIRRLTPQTPPLAYPGDVPASARLIAGPVTDLNVMTRRERCRHHLVRQTITESVGIVMSAGLILWESGAGTINADAQQSAAMVLDAFVATRPTRWHIAPQGTACFWVVRIEPAGQPAVRPL